MNKDDSCYTMMLPCWRFIDLYQNLSDSETDNAVIDDVNEDLEDLVEEDDV